MVLSSSFDALTSLQVSDTLGTNQNLNALKSHELRPVNSRVQVFSRLLFTCDWKPRAPSTVVNKMNASRHSKRSKLKNLIGKLRLIHKYCWPSRDNFH